MSYKAKKYSVKHVDFNSLATFIKFGTYPPGITENGKRNLRKRSQSFKVVDNQLFYTPVNASKEDGEPEISRPVISDEEEIQKLLSDLHVDEKGNHLGREKLGNKIRERFYFMGITKIVNSYIDNCSYCQVNRPSSRSSGILSEGSLSSLSSDTEEPETLVTSSPTICTNRIDVKVEGPSSKSAEAHRFWEIVEMNVLGPFTCKESKYYVVLFLDLFSYWPEAFVVDSLSPSTITHLLLKLLCRFGTMGTLMIRQTSESVQDNVSPRQDILSFLGLEITINHFGADSTYVIWDDIKESVRTFTENNHHWLYCLEFCLLPFRISRAENSEYTPSYITYGREIPIPEKIHQQNEASITTVEPHLNMEQMTKITDVLLEAFKMFGKFSQPLESFPMSHIENRDVASKSESSASLVSKAYNTRRSRDVNYRRLSTNGEVDPEAEEDMPPPGSVTPEPRRKRRKMSRPGRIKVEDEKLEESLKEETDQESSKNSSMDEETWEAVRRNIAHQVLASFHRNATTDLASQSVKSPPEPPIRKRHICEACGKEFSRSDTLKRHRRETHENESTCPNVCNECGITFKRKDHLRRHQNCAHKGQVLQCKYCEKSFGTRNKLDYHVMLEHDRRFQCDLCDKRFGSSTSFKRHLAAHENSEFRCPYCLQDFETKEVTKMHKEVCKLSMKYQCNVCGEAFKSKSSYQHHEASHYDGKFPCHTCGIKFSFSTNLNRHIRTVHSKNPDDDAPVTTQKETSVCISSTDVPAPVNEEDVASEHNSEQTVPSETYGKTIDTVTETAKEPDIPQTCNDPITISREVADANSQRVSVNLPGGDLQHMEEQSVEHIKDSMIEHASKLHKALHHESYQRSEQPPLKAVTHSELPQTFSSLQHTSYPGSSVPFSNIGNLSTGHESNYQRVPLPSVSIFNSRGALSTLFRYSDGEGSLKIGSNMSPFSGYASDPPSTTTVNNTMSYSHPDPPVHSSGTDLPLSQTFTDQRTLVMPMPMAGVRDAAILSATLEGNRTTQDNLAYGLDQDSVYQNQSSNIYLDRSEYAQEKL